MGDTTETRRGVLRWVGSGILAALAGCSATPGGAPSTATGPTTTHTATAQTTASEAETEQNAVKILDSEFRTVQKVIPPDNVVWGKLKNVGEKHVHTLEVEAIFRNESERVIGTQTASIEGLEPGGVWEPYLPSFETPEQVATGELTVKKVITGPPPDEPDAATVVEDSLRPPRDFEIPTAAGEVENTGEETIAFTVRASFYALDDILLDTGSVEVTGLGPEEIRTFEIAFEGYEVLAAPRVASYDVSLIE